MTIGFPACGTDDGRCCFFLTLILVVVSETLKNDVMEAKESRFLEARDVGGSTQSDFPGGVANLDPLTVETAGSAECLDGSPRESSTTEVWSKFGDPVGEGEVEGVNRLGSACTIDID